MKTAKTKKTSKQAKTNKTLSSVLSSAIAQNETKTSKKVVSSVKLIDKKKSSKKTQEEQAPTYAIDKRVKENRAYVSSLPDSLKMPKPGTKAHHARVIAGRLAVKSNSFTENDFLDAIARQCKCTREQVEHANSPEGKYPDGKLHSALYSLSCASQGTMKSVTKDGKNSNSFATMKKGLVRMGEGGGSIVSRNKGTWAIHPDLVKNNLVKEFFPDFPNASYDIACAFFMNRTQ